MFKRLQISLGAFAACVLASISSSAQEPSPSARSAIVSFYASSNSWSLFCVEEPERECTLYSVIYARDKRLTEVLQAGPLVVSLKSSSDPPILRLKLARGAFSHDIVATVDGDKEHRAACTSIEGDWCTIAGADADHILSMMRRGAADLAIRVYDDQSKPHDFQWPLKFFNEAMDNLFVVARAML